MRRPRLQRHLRALSRDDRAAVLRPLLTGPGEEYATREIAGRLRLDLGLAPEVAPAPAPDGRGDEGVEA